MHFKKFWRGLQSLLSRPCSPQCATVFLEPLEDRIVPTIVWSNAGSRAVVDYGGPVITHADVDLIFWGSGWSSAQGLKTNVINSVTTILNSSYLSGLSQYRGIGSAQLLRTDDVTSSKPATHTTASQFDAFVKASINSGILPITPNVDSQILYMVLPQPGTSDPAEFLGGAHGSDTSNFGRFHYGFTINLSNLDEITYDFSHELTEAVTDPEVNYHDAFWVPSTNDEICDGEAQNYSYRLNGVLVQSSLSQRDHAYEVYDSTSQRFILNSSRVLTVNGDQLSNTDDTITIDQRGGYRVVLNGEVAQFDALDFYTGAADVSSIVINTGGGTDTVNLEKTISGGPVRVNLGVGNDTVNLSPTSHLLSTLAGAITVNGNSGADTLNFFDQGLRSNQTYTITDTMITRSGIPRLLYSKSTNVIINTTNSTDMITVQGVPAGTTLTINGGSGSNTLTGPETGNIWTITGSNSGSLSGNKIAGLVTFNNVQTLVGGENNTFVFQDGAGESSSIRSGSGSSLDYSAYTKDVRVNLQAATATGVGTTFAGIQNITGGSGTNTLVGMNTSNVWNLTGMDRGTVTGSTTVSFTSFQNLTGGTAKNAFVFSDGAGISGNLDGGGGGSLDYSAYSSSVVVDLKTASGTGVGGSLTHIQNVVGGTGGGSGVYNVLVGNGGNVLTGGTGRRNLLIAGFFSASTLQGGDDEDILIGGTTIYDKDIASLLAIMDYWSTTSDDYATRVANLLAGNGVPLLDPTTVTSNGGSNTLTGGSGLNLYYGSNIDNSDFDPTSVAIFIHV